MKQRIKLRYILNIFLATIFSITLAILVLSIYFTNLWTQSVLRPNRIISSGDFLKENHIEYQDVTLITKDGLELFAWYMAPKNGAVILLAHGYNDNRPENLYVMFAKHGYGVLAWDFRAHGSSEGEISSLGYHEQLDVEAALDFALAQENVKDVGAWGGSMGGTTVLLTSAKRTEIKAVIADSAFPSLEDVLRLNMPIPFVQPFVLFFGEYHTDAQIEDVNAVDVMDQISPRAVFIIDGWQGGAILMNSPYSLYDAAHEPKEIWVEDGVPHLGMFTNNPLRYENKVIRFFDEYLLNP